MLSVKDIRKGMKLKMKSKEECEQINESLSRNAGLVSSMPYGKVVTVENNISNIYIRLEGSGWSYNPEWFDIYSPKENNLGVI